MNKDVSKEIRFCTESGAPGRVGSVNTIRLRHYGWNTSKEGSLRRKTKKKNKVLEIQLANLVSLKSIRSKNDISLVIKAVLCMLRRSIGP